MPNYLSPLGALLLSGALAASACICVQLRAAVSRSRRAEEGTLRLIDEVLEDPAEASCPRPRPMSQLWTFAGFGPLPSQLRTSCGSVHTGARRCEARNIWQPSARSQSLIPSHPCRGTKSSSRRSLVTICLQTLLTAVPVPQLLRFSGSPCGPNPKASYVVESALSHCSEKACACLSTPVSGVDLKNECL